MRPLIAFGEVLIDLLQDPKDASRYIRHAGGAPANVAVGFARLGGQARFLGARSADAFGVFLDRSLSAEGVDTAHMQVIEDAPTALAVVALDAAGERSFSFHRTSAADLRFDAALVTGVAFAGAPLFHFCSNSLTHANIRSATSALIQRAQDHGAVISFDVNLRPGLWPGGALELHPVRALMAAAHVVKASREEWSALSADAPDLAARCLDGATQLIIVTDGPRAMQVIDPNGERVVDVAAVPVVDSTAAGDAFMAGMLACAAHAGGGSFKLQAVIDCLASREWQDAALAFAARCGGLACGRYGAFASLPTRAEVGLAFPPAPAT